MTRGEQERASILDRIAEVAGNEAAARIAAAFGGRRLYIPVNLPADHRLCRLVGFEAAALIRHEIGAGHLDVPLGHRRGDGATRRAVAAMTAQGMSASTIARRLGITQRTVHNHRRALRAGLAR